MPKVFASLVIISLSALIASLAGCNATSSPPPLTFAPPPTLPATQATTQPMDVVAELSTLKITRADLDSLLYETYGLRMLFDIVELDLAKNTVTELGRTVTPADVQTERQMILAKICGDSPPSSYEELFNQFLQQQHLTRAEFDIRIVQTNAYLRKIVAPAIVGKLPVNAVHRGFEQLYGAKRQIADIELANALEATRARNLLKTQSFSQVAQAMSMDRESGAMGGEWQPFSIQSPMVPQAIKDAAFAMDEGQISDNLEANSHIHIIKLLKVIEPRVVKFETVKDDVQKQLEDQLIESTMKKLRDELTAKTQREIVMDNPILKAQWDAILDQQTKSTDRESARKKLDESMPHPATMPSNNP